MESLFYEVKLISPTYFGGAPRIWTSFYHIFLSTLKKQLEESKLNLLNNQDQNSFDPFSIEKKLLYIFSQSLGHRIKRFFIFTIIHFCNIII